MRYFDALRQGKNFKKALPPPEKGRGEKEVCHLEGASWCKQSPFVFVHLALPSGMSVVRGKGVDGWLRGG